MRSQPLESKLECISQANNHSIAKALFEKPAHTYTSLSAIILSRWTGLKLIHTTGVHGPCSRDVNMARQHGCFLSPVNTGREHRPCRKKALSCNVFFPTRPIFTGADTHYPCSWAVNMCSVYRPLVGFQLDFPSPHLLFSTVQQCPSQTRDVGIYSGLLAVCSLLSVFWLMV